MSATTEKERWDRSVASLKGYIESTGSANPPQSYVTESGHRLGTWVTTVRAARRKGKLSPERDAELTELGFEFDKYQSIWNKNLAALKAYHEAHGDVMVPFRYIDGGGVKLGQFVQNTRKFAKSGEIKPERRAQLDELGFVWEIRPGRAAPEV